MPARKWKSLWASLLLAAIISSVYAPFLGSRLLRMAGDEKVYISQALEMERDGHWFVQTLQDVPNYHKGPAHYLLLRIGMKIFGRSPWAVLYMNYFLLLAGSFALAAIVRRRLPEWKGGDIWTGAAFALGAGIYAHTFTSQMEIEAAALFAIALYFLDRSEKDQSAIGFWIVAGLIGWLKSPLHSAFAGCSAVLFWALTGQLVARLKNPRAWLAAAFGVAICIGGYLPAYMMDRQNFWEAYVVRESLNKTAGSGQHWSVAVFSAFGFYLFPWLLPALVAYAQFILQSPRLLRNDKIFGGVKRMLVLGFSTFIPSVAFFIWHPYHFENYNLPVISGIWLAIAAVMGSLSIREKMHGSFWETLYSISLGLTAVLLLAIPIGVTVLAQHFAPLPAWWPGWLVPAIWVSTLVTVVGFLLFGVLLPVKRPAMLALSSAGVLWGLTALFSVLGEREMLDLRRYIASNEVDGNKISLVYDNLNRNIWSEWGYLNFWVPEQVKGIHTPETMKAAIEQGDVILVSSKENGVEDFRTFVAKEEPSANLRYIPWKRWRTRGQSDSGKPLWQEAWERHDLSLLETDYFIVETASHNTTSSR